MAKLSVKPYAWNELSSSNCRAHVEASLAPASEALPGELLEVLGQNATARTAWEAMTTSQQRALREHVLGAKKSETRARRARRALL